MAPEWGRAVRPVALLAEHRDRNRDHDWFKANVDAQAGVYATGILVMMMSGAFAVTLAMARPAPRRSPRLALVTALLVYALTLNIVDKPDGIIISLLFIAAMAAVSLASRLVGTTELRADRIEFDELALAHITEAAAAGSLHFAAHRYHFDETPEELEEKERQQRLLNPIPPDAHVILVEVQITDPLDLNPDRSWPADCRAPRAATGEPGRAQRARRVDAAGP